MAARSQKLTVVVAGDASGLKRAFASAEGAAGGFERRMGTLQKNAARSFLAIGAAAGVGFGAIAKQTVDFDRSMRNVNSLAQLGERRFKTLQNSVLNLAGKTAQAPKTLADGLYDLVSSGFDAKQAMTILASSAKAATAGLTTTEVSTKAVAAVLNAYHRPAKDPAEISDTLFQTVNRGVLSFEDLANTIGDTLPFASSLGVSLNEVGAATSTMTKEGLSAEETMTRIRNVMTTLLKPGDALQGAYKQLGVQSGEALIKQKGFQGALEAIVGTTNGTKSAVAQLFPNIRSLGGVLALTGKNAKSAQGDLKAFQDTTGATDKVLEQQRKSISYQWQKIRSEISSTAIRVGSVLVPAFRTGLEKVAGFLGTAGGNVKDFVDDFTDKVGALRKGGKGLGAAIGGAFLDQVKQIDWSPIGDAVSTGLSAGLDLSGKLPGLVSKGFEEAASNIDGRKLLGGLLDVVGDALDALFSPSFWKEHFAAIFSILTVVIPVGKIFKIPGFNVLYNTLSKQLFTAIERVGKGLASLFGKVGSEAFVSFLSQLEKFAPRTAQALLAVVTGSTKALRSFPGKVADQAKLAVNVMALALGDGAGRVAALMARLVATGVKALGDGVAKFAGAAGRIALAILGKFDDLARNVPSSLGKALASGTAKMRDWIGNFAKAALDIGKSIVREIVAGMGNLGHAILDKIKGAVSWVGDKAKDVAGFLNPFGDGVGKKITRAVVGAAGAGAATGAATKGASGSLMGADGALAPYAAIGASDGLHVSSGKRVAGGRTISGGISYHGSGEAIDMAGSPGGMLKFFKTLRSKYGSRLAELIYTPGGVGIKDGRPFQYTGAVAAQHLDHVHVAVDLGRPGPGIGDGTGRPMASAARSLSGVNLAIDAAYKAGFRGEALVDMVAIAGRESSYVPTTQNLKYPDHSIGLWQINQLAHKGRYGSDAELKNPYTNARAAYALYKAAGLSPWQHAGGPLGGTNIGAARAAVRAFLTGGGSSRGGGGSGSPSRSSLERRIATNQDKIDALRERNRHLPTGKAGHAQRVANQDKIANLLRQNRHIRSQISGLPKDVDEPSSFEQQVATADLGIAEATPGGDGPVGGSPAALNLAAADRSKRLVINQRIRKIRAALKKKLTPKTRVRLQNELADLIGQSRDLLSNEQQLKTAPTLDATGEDPNQPLIDAINAAAQIQADNTAAIQAHTDAVNATQAELKRQTDTAVALNQTDSFTIKKYLADLLSGQIGGYGILPRSRTPGTGALAAY